MTSQFQVFSGVVLDKGGPGGEEVERKGEGEVEVEGGRGNEGSGEEKVSGRKLRR